MHIAASAALLLVVLGLTGGAWFFWDQSQPALIPAGRFPVTVGLLLATVACARSLLRNRRWPSATELSNPVVWSFGLVIIIPSLEICLRDGVRVLPQGMGETARHEGGRPPERQRCQVCTV